MHTKDENILAHSDDRPCLTNSVIVNNLGLVDSQS